MDEKKKGNKTLVIIAIVLILAYMAYTMVLSPSGGLAKFNPTSGGSSGVVGSPVQPAQSEPGQGGGDLDGVEWSGGK